MIGIQRIGKGLQLVFSFDVILAVAPVNWVVGPQKGGLPTGNTTGLGPLTLFEHAHFEALGETASLAGLPAALCDLTLVGCWTAILNVA